MYDIVIIGGGPAGAAAAVKAATMGKSPLLVEQKKFPRKKACSGLIMSRLAVNTAQNIFNNWPPENIYSKQLKGITLHIGPTDMRTIEHQMQAFWREELDNWMLKQANQNGTEVRQNRKFIRYERSDKGYKIYLKAPKGEEVVVADKIVGADGAASRVRRETIPDFKGIYSFGYQGILQGTINLNPDYFHIFSNPEIAPYYVCLHQKQNHLVFEIGAPTKHFQNIYQWGVQLLKDKYGLKVDEVIFEKGCLEPLLYQNWFKGKPPIGKERVLLAGDAAGLVVPISGEGIGLALFSGSAAAETLITNDDKITERYLDKLQQQAFLVEKAYHRVRRVKEASAKGAKDLIDYWEQAWRETIAEW